MDKHQLGYTQFGFGCCAIRAHEIPTAIPCNLPALLLQEAGDVGCARRFGAPRVQPLNDYRLLFMVKKGLDTYLKNNNVSRLSILQLAVDPASQTVPIWPVRCSPIWHMQCFSQVYAACGNDYRLYASPLIKFQKACYQLVNGGAWYLSGAARSSVATCPAGQRFQLLCLPAAHHLLPQTLQTVLTRLHAHCVPSPPWMDGPAACLLPLPTFLLTLPPRSVLPPCSARGLPLLWQPSQGQWQDCGVPRIRPLACAQPVRQCVAALTPAGQGAAIQHPGGVPLLSGAMLQTDC